MAWTLPRTWVSGEIVTAANMNTHVRDNLLAISGVWTSWTPTVTQSGSVTVTNTLSRYSRVGRLITGYFRLDVTGSGSASNPVIISGLPATAATSALEIGTGNIRDSSVLSNYPGFVFLGSTTTFDLRSTSEGAADDNRLGVANFTAALASGDSIRGSFHYEAATD